MRFPTGVSRDRFNLITAVLAKHARLKVCLSVESLWCDLQYCAQTQQSPCSKLHAHTHARAHATHTVCDEHED